MHQIRCEWSPGVEFGAVPIGFEALDDLFDLVLVRGDDGVVAGLGEVLGLPVQRLDEGVLSSMTMDFSWVRSKRGLLSMTSTPASVRVLRDSSFSFSPLRRCGIEHDANLDAALVGGDDGLEERGIGEDEHLDREATFGVGMASRIGLAESSGRTITERDMGFLRGLGIR